MKNKEKALKICKKTIQILICIQIILGIIFVVRNIKYVPQYGDTSEYLEIAETMKLDSYRPFVYPVLLNISGKIAKTLAIDLTYVIYFIQLAINLFTSITLISTLKEILKIKLSKKETAIYSLFIFFIPFNLHFNMSILCDSIATSFTILFICYLMKYLKNEKYRNAIYAVITMFIASNIRSERIYFLSFVLISVIIIEFIIYLIKKQKIDIKKIGILFAILVVGIISTKIAQAIFQDSTIEGRSQPSISMYLYERVIGNTLPQIYEYLPEDIKQVITYEDAVASSQSANAYKEPYETLYKIDGNTSRIKTIMKVAIRRNFPNIMSNIMKDFGKNMISPYYFVINDTNGNYEWTKTRMEGDHYLFTDAYILYFEVLFIIINIYLIFNIDTLKLLKCKELEVIGLYAIVSSGFFAVLTSQNFHIRYIMPVYVVEIALATILFSQKVDSQVK